MKKDIHPNYYADAQIICACGHKMTVGSTVKKIHVEICSNCHPFYTGKEKLIDTAGRVDRFKKIQELQKKTAQTRKGKAVKKQRAAVRKLAKERDRVKQEIKENREVKKKSKTVKTKKNTTKK